MPYAENDGASIYWEERGSGEPLLLIMGLGYTLDMWYRISGRLQEHYRTILFDNRGVGRSSVPPGPYTIRQMAADAAAVLDRAGVESAHIFGVSMGGMIAQEFALEYPRRVKSLILGCTHHGGPRAVAPSPEAIITLLARATMSMEEALRATNQIIYDPATPDERIEEDLAIRRRNFPTAEGYTAQLQGAMAWECYGRLPEIAAPTLVIHGESDRLVSAENGKLLADAIPGAELVLLPAASHLFLTDQLEASSRAILSFLSRHKDN